MSNILDRAKLSDIIRSATQEMVSRTEAFVRSAEGAPDDPGAVSIMINGEKKSLPRTEYDALKSQNNETKERMKAAIKVLKDEFKVTIEQEAKK